MNSNQENEFYANVAQFTVRRFESLIRRGFDWSDAFAYALVDTVAHRHILRLMIGEDLISEMAAISDLVYAWHDGSTQVGQVSALIKYAVNYGIDQRIDAIY
jgi:hypothetical protein